MKIILVARDIKKHISEWQDSINHSVEVLEESGCSIKDIRIMITESYDLAMILFEGKA